MVAVIALTCADEDSFQQKRRYFIETKTGTMIAVDQILWYRWNDDRECYAVRLGDEGITTHMVEQDEMRKIGAVW